MYDEALAERIRTSLQGEPGIEEKSMFGGRAFLVRGNMAVAASGEGGILVRADPEQSGHLVSRSHAEEAVMRGRPMAGWLRVAPEHLRTRRQLEKWVDVGVAFARSLPPKPARQPDPR
jgi:hypothetical protein